MSQTEVQLIKNGAVVDADINGMSSSKLSGALPAISGASLTNLPTPTGKTRNLIINGAMQVAQRGTSATTNGYGSVDRFQVNYDSGLTEAPTQEQLNLSSSDTPYASGFRNAFRITNGNQTSQDANDYIQLVQKIEAQDIAQSGWNYTSSSSNITLSFWVRASIAQTFYVKIQANDNARSFTFPINVTTSWQKLTKTISGDSNLVFNNDTGTGMEIRFIPYYGTTYTDSGHSINTWIVSTGTNQTPDYANTWFSGNDATFDVTGVQLEVGSVATDFEHRSFAQELALCQRYFYMHAFGAYVYTPNRPDSTAMGMATQYTTTAFYGIINFPVQMRAHPSFVKSLGTDRLLFYYNTGAQGFNDITTQDFGVNSSIIKYYDSLNSSAQSGWVQLNNNSAYVGFDAEL